MKVTVIIENNPATLAERVNFFIKDMNSDVLVDIKFTTDVGDMESWYNAMIIYKK